MRYMCINIQLNKNTHALTEPHINAVISKVSKQKQILDINQLFLTFNNMIFHYMLTIQSKR